MERKNAWESYDKKTMKQVDKFASEYIDFISECKTERECTDYIVNTIEAAGYRELQEVIREGKKLKTGDKVYSVQMNKSVVMFKIGKKPISAGLNILGAHIDSPRLDIKQNPLYEDGGVAYLDTHYYGGVKKYQWVTIPLALHGVVVKKDGTTIELNIGENDDDPVFFVSDLLIHLAADQMEKKASKVIEGEALDIIIGSKPLVITDKDKDKDKEEKSAKKSKEEKSKDPVKSGILKILKEEYDFEEEDFLSAEIEVVPAGRARECGFDKSLILGYGHDDRVCAYPSMRAMLDTGDVEKSACCILVDKEEIGSVGATGMESRFFENAVSEVMDLTEGFSELKLKRALAASCMLSSDVSAAFDPSYADAFDKKNAAFLGRGLVFNKFTGSRGKSGSNDANAEYIAYLREILDTGKVFYQTAELGKVDKGGGGTIAYILALYGMNVIDSGVAVLNMHAPWEAISKADLYESLKGYMAFLEGKGM
ncbi:MAG: aminopeptidase [Lachnospiraceae bacterium]|nr:aminopeptidase [Lachnospiraceae bacterium]